VRIFLKAYTSTNMLGAALLATALTAVAVASPMNKRDLIVVTDIVTDLVVVTETADAAAVTPAPFTPAVSAPVPPVPVQAWPHHGGGYSFSASISTFGSEESETAPAPVVSQTSSVAASPATSTSTTASATSPTDFVGMVVAHHNAHRANHSAPALTWDASLANTAAKIAASCYYAHNT
jgi:uncharacterized protein YkwD